MDIEAEMLLGRRGFGQEFVSCKAAVACRAWDAEEDVHGMFATGNVIEDAGSDIGHHVVVDKCVVNGVWPRDGGPRVDVIGSHMGKTCGVG